MNRSASTEKTFRAKQAPTPTGRKRVNAFAWPAFRIKYYDTYNRQKVSLKADSHFFTVAWWLAQKVNAH